MASIAAIHSARRHRAKQAALAQLLEERQQAEQRAVSEWFERFDDDSSGFLSKDQLRNLLSAVDPSHVPKDSFLEYLIAKCNAVHPHPAQEGVTREQVTAVRPRFSPGVSSPAPLGRVGCHEVSGVRERAGAAR
jgi:Ca2+-binding EF-hand superfamily protein